MNPYKTGEYNPTSTQGVFPQNRENNLQVAQSPESRENSPVLTLFDHLEEDKFIIKCHQMGFIDDHGLLKVRSFFIPPLQECDLEPFKTLLSKSWTIKKENGSKSTICLQDFLSKFSRLVKDKLDIQIEDIKLTGDGLYHLLNRSQYFNCHYQQIGIDFNTFFPQSIRSRLQKGSKTIEICVILKRRNLDSFNQVKKAFHSLLKIDLPESQQFLDGLYQSFSIRCGDNHNTNINIKIMECLPPYNVISNNQLQISIKDLIDGKKRPSMRLNTNNGLGYERTTIQTIHNHLCGIITWHDISEIYSKEWIRLLSKYTRGYRLLYLFDEEKLLESFLRQNTRSQIVQKLKNYLDDDPDPYRAIAMTFHMCLNHKLTEKEKSGIWKNMHAHFCQKKKQNTLLTTLNNLITEHAIPFDFVASFLEIMAFIRLCSGKQRGPKIFLTKNNQVPSLCIKETINGNEYSLLLPFQPLNAMKTIQGYLENKVEPSKLKSLYTILLSECLIQIKQKEQTELNRYQEFLDLQTPNLHDYANNFLKHESNFISQFGQYLASALQTLEPSNTTLHTSLMNFHRARKVEIPKPAREFLFQSIINGLEHVITIEKKHFDLVDELYDTFCKSDFIQWDFLFPLLELLSKQPDKRLNDLGVQMFIEYSPPETENIINRYKDLAYDILRSFNDSQTYEACCILKKLIKTRSVLPTTLLTDSVNIIQWCKKKESSHKNCENVSRLLKVVKDLFTQFDSFKLDDVSDKKKAKVSSSLCWLIKQLAQQFQLESARQLFYKVLKHQLHVHDDPTQVQLVSVQLCKMIQTSPTHGPIKAVNLWKIIDESKIWSYRDPVSDVQSFPISLTQELYRIQDDSAGELGDSVVIALLKWKMNSNLKNELKSIWELYLSRFVKNSKDVKLTDQVNAANILMRLIKSRSSRSQEFVRGLINKFLSSKNSENLKFLKLTSRVLINTKVLNLFDKDPIQICELYLQYLQHVSEKRVKLPEAFLDHLKKYYPLLIDALLEKEAFIEVDKLLKLLDQVGIRLNSKQRHNLAEKLPINLNFIPLVFSLLKSSHNIRKIALYLKIARHYLDEQSSQDVLKILHHLKDDPEVQTQEWQTVAESCIRLFIAQHKKSKEVQTSYLKLALDVVSDYKIRDINSWDEIFEMIKNQPNSSLAQKCLDSLMKNEDHLFHDQPQARTKVWNSCIQTLVSTSNKNILEFLDNAEFLDSVFSEDESARFAFLKAALKLIRPRKSQVKHLIHISPQIEDLFGQYKQINRREQVVEGLIIPYLNKCNKINHTSVLLTCCKFMEEIVQNWSIQFSNVYLSLLETISNKELKEGDVLSNKIISITKQLQTFPHLKLNYFRCAQHVIKHPHPDAIKLTLWALTKGLESNPSSKTDSNICVRTLHKLIVKGSDRALEKVEKLLNLPICSVFFDKGATSTLWAKLMIKHFTVFITDEASEENKQQSDKAQNLFEGHINRIRGNQQLLKTCIEKSVLASIHYLVRYNKENFISVINRILKSCMPLKKRNIIDFKNYLNRYSLVIDILQQTIETSVIQDLQHKQFVYNIIFTTINNFFKFSKDGTIPSLLKEVEKQIHSFVYSEYAQKDDDFFASHIARCILILGSISASDSIDETLKRESIKKMYPYLIRSLKDVQKKKVSKNHKTFSMNAGFTLLRIAKNLKIIPRTELITLTKSLVGLLDPKNGDNFDKHTFIFAIQLLDDIKYLDTIPSQLIDTFIKYVIINKPSDIDILDFTDLWVENLIKMLIKYDVTSKNEHIKRIEKLIELMPEGNLKDKIIVLSIFCLCYQKKCKS